MSKPLNQPILHTEDYTIPDNVVLSCPHAHGALVFASNHCARCKYCVGVLQQYEFGKFDKWSACFKIFCNHAIARACTEFANVEPLEDKLK
jgi:hypothetical protein